MASINKSNNSEEQSLKELRQIKGLLILLLIKLGATSEEIAQASGVGESTIRTMFPMRKIKKIPLD